MRKINSKTIEEKVCNAAKALNLEDLLDRKPKQLSGGQRQRVALGRAIVRSPKVFLMDEPLSNLDANLRVHMRAEIKKLHKDLQTTFIYVTHDQTEALTMGDRIVVLDQGVIQQVASPNEIYNNPKNKFVAGFIGQMNFFEADIVDNKLLIEGYSIGLNKQINSTRVLVGVRAEKMLAGDINIKVKTDIVEMTGGEKNVYCILNGAKCIAKVPLDYEFGNFINLNLSVDNMYFFDINNGRNLFYS